MFSPVTPRHHLYSTTEGRMYAGASSQDSAHLNVLKSQGVHLFLDVVPKRVVEHLPEQLQRGVGAVGIRLGQIQIIHEHHTLLAKRRPEHTCNRDIANNMQERYSYTGTLIV